MIILISYFVSDGVPTISASSIYLAPQTLIMSKSIMKGNPAAQHAIALVKVKLNEEKHPDAELL